MSGCGSRELRGMAAAVERPVLSLLGRAAGMPSAAVAQPQGVAGIFHSLKVLKPEEAGG